MLFFSPPSNQAVTLAHEHVCILYVIFGRGSILANNTSAILRDDTEATIQIVFFFKVVLLNKVQTKKLIQIVIVYLVI